MGSANPKKLPDLLAQLATEIGKARVGSDQDQFTILDLFFSLRKESATDPKLADFQERVKKAVDYMICIVEAGKPYVAEQIEVLNQTLSELTALSDGSSATPPTASSAAPPRVALTISAPTASPDSASTPSLQLPPEIPVNVNLSEDADILREYINESQEHLDSIEQGVLVLEKTPDDSETLNTVFRAFHSFKGGAGFLNLTPIHQAAHELESLLDAARKRVLRIDSSVIELILQGADVLRQFVAEILAQISGKKAPGPIIVQSEPLKAKVRATIDRAKGEAEGSKAAPAPATVPVVFAPPPPPKSEPVSITAVPAPKRGSEAPNRSAPSKVADAKASPSASAALSTPPTSAEASESRPASSESPKLPVASNSVKVDTQKLDSLVDLVGELVIAQSFVAQHPDLKAITSQFFTRSLSQLLRITRELQRTSMAMRMVPIGGTFQRMMRIVRDLTTKQQKRVKLVLSGEETELDRTIVEDIAAPLMHMVRNSVDHGMEAPDRRAAIGKPPEGTIHLRAYHQGGNVVIQIEDDGKGLSRERILNKAIEKGLAVPNAELTDNEVFQFIFAPGFSTAETVTDTSGRGVGMDVVKRSIEKLHGKIEIDSQQGVGTIITIYLPLTLAIIEALVVSAGDQRFVIPTLSVRESFQLRPEMLSTVYNRGELVKVRDRLIPLLRLTDYFNIKPQAPSAAPGGIVVVLEAGRATRCLLVDQLLHKQEVVIKSLGPALKGNRALAGAAILGDGRVGLILDVNALVQLKPTQVPIAA